jgi:hypothetical protein
MEFFTALTTDSANKKTGNIAVSTTSRNSCAVGCPFLNENGCYADAGYHTRMYWDKVSSGKKGVSPLDFIKLVHNLPGNEMFRHNVAGDLWTTKENVKEIDLCLLSKLAKASSHLYAAWTYTHHELDGEVGTKNRTAIKESAKYNFIINISTESLDVAAQRHKEGLLTTVVQPEGLPTSFQHNGVSFVQCPATLPGSTITCRTCGGRRNKPLCARGRDVVVIFPAHGSRKKVAVTHCS